MCECVQVFLCTRNDLQRQSSFGLTKEYYGHGVLCHRKVPGLVWHLSKTDLLTAICFCLCTFISDLFVNTWFLLHLKWDHSLDERTTHDLSRPSGNSPLSPPAFKCLIELQISYAVIHIKPFAGPIKMCMTCVVWIRHIITFNALLCYLDFLKLKCMVIPMNCERQTVHSQSKVPMNIKKKNQLGLPNGCVALYIYKPSPIVSTTLSPVQIDELGASCAFRVFRVKPSVFRVFTWNALAGVEPPFTVSFTICFVMHNNICFMARGDRVAPNDMCVCECCASW